MQNCARIQKLIKGLIEILVAVSFIVVTYSKVSDEFEGWGD